ncbi:MAG: HD domain-containing phosphohydrolase [Treponema sp.]|nr:HD domain-containing phosphohydrolase [Treponema sp.]
MSRTDEQFFLENLTKINKNIEIIFLIFCLVPIIFILFTLVGLWTVSHVHSCILLISSIASTITLAIFNRKNVHQKFAMYFGIIMLCFEVSFMNYTNTIRLFISYAIVPIISLLYYNKRLTMVTCVVNYFLMIFSSCITATAKLEVITGRFSPLIWCIQFAIGLTIESVFLFVALSNISNRIQKTLANLMQTFDEKNDALDQLKDRNELVVRINNELEEKNVELKDTQSKIIKFVAECLGSHDLFTGRHVIHTQKYVELICNELVKKGLYTDELTEKNIDNYQLSAFLHDIGKIHIPEGILNKIGKFTPEEFDLMKSHPQEGNKLLNYLPPIENGEFNKIAKQMALYHHEKWDGTGYPFGLKGYEIPLCARIMTAADVLDALISQRLYKEPMSIDEAIEVFEKSSGIHFEPAIAQAVIDNKHLITLIDNDFKTSEAETNAQELQWWKAYHENIKRIQQAQQ